MEWRSADSSCGVVCWCGDWTGWCDDWTGLDGGDRTVTGRGVQKWDEGKGSGVSGAAFQKYVIQLKNNINTKFKPKYATSDVPDAKAAQTKWDGVLKTCDEQLPIMLAADAINSALAQTCDKSNAANQLAATLQKVAAAGGSANATVLNDLKKYYPIVKSGFQAFMKAYGESKNPVAVKAIARIQPLVDQADGLMPGLTEGNEVDAAVKKLEAGKVVDRLSDEVKKATSAAEITKYLSQVRAVYKDFHAKYEKSNNETAKKWIARIDPLLKTGDELVVSLGANADFSNAVAAIAKNNAQLALEQSIDQSDAFKGAGPGAPRALDELKKKYDDLQNRFNTFKSKFPNDGKRSEVKAVYDKYEPLLAQAVKSIATNTELIAVHTAINGLNGPGQTNALIQLEQAIRLQNNSADLSKWLGIVKPLFEAFKAQWSGKAAAIPLVAETITKYGEWVGEAERLVPSIQEFEKIQSVFHSTSSTLFLCSIH